MANIKSCPVCQSDDLYQYKDDIQYSGVGEELLPKLGGGTFSVAKIRPIICANCGCVQLVASSEVREKVKASKHWRKI